MKNVQCPLCGKQKYSVLHKSTLTKEDYDLNKLAENLKNTLNNQRKYGQIVKCLNCNLVYTNPQEDLKDLMEGYEKVVDNEYLQTEKFRKILSKKHLDVILKFKTSGTMLDVGCFSGFFLELAKNAGWEGYGLEPSKWAKKISQKKGIKILGGDIEKTKLKENFFDVITLWDVIEHISNPKVALKKIHTILKKDGIVAIGTPDIESLVAKILGSKNPYIIRMHLIYFSPKTLRRILEEEGFKVIYQGTYGRTFPLSYILKLFKFKHSFFDSMKNKLSLIPFLSKIPITLNLGDSVMMIAKKYE